MKTLLATTGGRPLKNEDAKLFEQLLTMLEGFAGDIQDGLIMSGVEITGTPGDYSVSDGYIYYDGAICTFVAVTGVSLPYVMEKFEVDGTPREFFDAATKDTINLVSISAQVGGGFSLDSNTKRLAEFIRVGAWQTPSYEAGFSAGTNPFQYRLNQGKLEFRGDIDTTVANGNAFTLTAAYRPMADTYITMVRAGAVPDVYWIRVEADGDVYSLAWTTSAANTLNTSVILD